jgi:hypothetical protein
VKQLEPAQLRFRAGPNIKQQVISIYFAKNQQKPYKGQYTFKKL